MIDIYSYTTEEIDLLYSVVEEAVKTREPIEMYKIDHIVHRGDFCLTGSGANGLHFTFNGLKWVDDDGDIFTCLIQPQVIYGCTEPMWYPVITINDRDRGSWGRLHMIKKENRYINANMKWR